MKFARILSTVAHPVFMPLLSVFLIFHSGSIYDLVPFRLMSVVYLIVGISTILLPLSILPMLKNQNVISDLALDKRQDRMIPLAASMIFYLLGYYMLQKFPVMQIFADLQLAAVISILTVSIISLKWKISLHMAGIGGLLGMILAFSIEFSSFLQLEFIIGILIAGLLGYSRLKLNLHTPSQVYTGFMLGFTIIFSSVLLM
ncbi:hypothetical protein [Labilibaculum sp.]|uniref:hypothetical protein n=1 Tax=Labilibaculum sp. TaxID=2060723 RepID=UPI0035638E54